MSRPLPILMPGGELPSGEALAALRQAKWATGYKDLVYPAQALQGSPEPILAVGTEPDWLCSYAYIPSFDIPVERLTATLSVIFSNEDDPRLGGEEDLLSKWMGCDVTLVKEEKDERTARVGFR